MPEIITDAELVNQFAQKMMEEPEKVIETRAPSESEIELPGGFIEQNGNVLTTADVKELTGADEEAIQKAGSTGKALNVLLQRGLVKIGSRDITKDDLDSLLSGDRDAILIGIRRVTFGDELGLRVRCVNCSAEQDISVHLIKDVPLKKLQDPIKDRVWEVTTKKGVAKVTLPTGFTQKKIMENNDKTSAELNTLILSSCLLSIDGKPSAGASTVLSLGMADRQTIIDSILERNPGPRLGEVKKDCEACGESIELPLGLLDLFRI